MAKRKSTKDEEVKDVETPEVEEEVVLDDETVVPDGANETPADQGEDKVDSVNPEDTPPSVPPNMGGGEDDPPAEETPSDSGQPHRAAPTDEVSTDDETEPEIHPSLTFPVHKEGTEETIPKTRGVYIVALGDKARDAAIRGTGTLHKTNPTLPITVVSDRVLGVPGVTDIRPESDNPVLEKLNADKAPYGYVVYLDADTYANADLEAGFKVLEDGWDMVIVPANKKGEAVLHGVLPSEVEATCAALGNYEPLRLQGTCIFFRKSSAVKRFFAVWREEWSKRKGLDRSSMLRALKRAPIKVWFFGDSYNNGSVISHHRGTAQG